ncbi:MAG: methyltransferase domain-containing protein [Actinomycetota bacterium]|nr:methyltransferase domain-containing protein [Actinomycetota bacterium]
MQSPSDPGQARGAAAPSAPPATGTSAASGAAGRATGRLQRRARWWDRRSRSWDHGGATGLERIVAAVLDASDVSPGAMVVDLGCGTGSVSIPLAERGARVTAVDLSPSMLELLVAKAAEAGVQGITTLAAPLEDLELPPGSVDLIVSNYALHHLRDRDKEALVASALGWLRPGGRMVIGDMMFGRGTSARDRSIIGSKAAVMLRRGPAGWWRLVKNVGRFWFRMEERPVTMETWERYFRQAGFSQVAATPVRLEAAVVAGTKPGP